MHGRAVSERDFLTGGGETGALITALDWSASPLGPPEGWSQSLRTVVSLLLTSKFPMFLAWGPDLGCIYNDGYPPILGTKHPRAMGRPFRDVWSDIWSDISPLVEKALLGEATFHEDLPLTMLRNGFEEQTYFTFSYSPVRAEGGIGGLFCACRETTLEVKARAALRQEKERLTNLFRQAPGFMAVLRGPEHTFELTNDAYLKLVGHRELNGKPVRQALPELAGQGFFDLLDRVYQSGEPFVDVPCQCKSTEARRASRRSASSTSCTSRPRTRSGVCPASSWKATTSRTASGLRQRCARARPASATWRIAPLP